MQFSSLFAKLACNQKSFPELSWWIQCDKRVLWTQLNNSLGSGLSSGDIHFCPNYAVLKLLSQNLRAIRNHFLSSPGESNVTNVFFGHSWTIPWVRACPLVTFTFAIIMQFSNFVAKLACNQKSFPELSWWIQCDKRVLWTQLNNSLGSGLSSGDIHFCHNYAVLKFCRKTCVQSEIISWALLVNPMWQTCSLDTVEQFPGFGLVLWWHSLLPKLCSSQIFVKTCVQSEIISWALLVNPMWQTCSLDTVEQFPGFGLDLWWHSLLP